MRVHASILVQRPIAVVFGYLSAPDHLPVWVAGVSAAEGLPPDERDVGALLFVDRSAPPGHARSTWEVIAYEPPRSLALRRLDEAPAGTEVRWTLEGLPSRATRVWAEAHLMTSSFFQCPAADLAEMTTRQMQHDLLMLRLRLESEESAV